MPREKKTEKIVLRVKPSFKQEAQQLADVRGTSVTGLFEDALDKLKETPEAPVIQPNDHRDSQILKLRNALLSVLPRLEAVREDAKDGPSVKKRMKDPLCAYGGTGACDAELIAIYSALYHSYAPDTALFPAPGCGINMYQARHALYKLISEMPHRLTHPEANPAPQEPNVYDSLCDLADPQT